MQTVQTRSDQQECKILLARSHLRVKCYAGRVKVMMCGIFSIYGILEKIGTCRANNLFRNFTPLDHQDNLFDSDLDPNHWTLRLNVVIYKGVGIKPWRYRKCLNTHLLKTEQDSSLTRHYNSPTWFLKTVHRHIVTAN